MLIHAVSISTPLATGTPPMTVSSISYLWKRPPTVQQSLEVSLMTQSKQGIFLKFSTVISLSDPITESISWVSFLNTSGFSKMQRIMVVRKLEVVSDPATVKVLISSTSSSSLMISSPSLEPQSFLLSSKSSSIMFLLLFEVLLGESAIFLTQLLRISLTSLRRSKNYLSCFLHLLFSNFSPNISSKGSPKLFAPSSTNFSRESTIDLSLYCS